MPRFAIRERGLQALDTLRFFDLFLLARERWPRRTLAALNYHRVLDGPSGLDEGVVSASCAEFDRQMALVARHASAISIDDLCAALDGGRALPKNPVLLTFDDGYLDNYELALPILRKHGVRATFFITTNYIGTNRLPWWDRVAYLMRHTRFQELKLRYPRELSLSLATPNARRLAQRTVLHVIKRTYGLDMDRFLQELEAAAGLAIDEPALAKRLFMDWDHVRGLHRAGMDLGAHTMSHRVLQTLVLAEAEREIMGSQRILTEQIGEPMRAIAYPVGYPLGRFSGLWELVAKAGFSLGFTFVPGLIEVNEDVDRFNLPRLAVDSTTRAPGVRFKTSLSFPNLLV